jgi:hypothetical protein
MHHVLQRERRLADVFWGFCEEVVGVVLRWGNPHGTGRSETGFCGCRKWSMAADDAISLALGRTPQALSLRRACLLRRSISSTVFFVISQSKRSKLLQETCHWVGVGTQKLELRYLIFYRTIWSTYIIKFSVLISRKVQPLDRHISG